MIKKLLNLYKEAFSSKTNGGRHDRLTKIVVKNSSISLVVKFCTILCGLFTMRVVYRNLDAYQFGVYATVTSLISWIDIFDFGISQGLRNKLNNARVEGNVVLGRRLISTSYCLMFIIALSVFVLYCLFFKVINWQVILNAMELDRGMLDEMAFWVVSLFLVRFVGSIIGKVFSAFQKGYYGSYTQLLVRVLYLALVLLLAKLDKFTIMNVAVFHTAICAIIPILAALVFFFFVEPLYKPSFKMIDFKLSSQILGLGWKFFVIQVALLVIHTGNNFLISHFVSPEGVAAYSLSYQLFSYGLMVFAILLGPTWSAHTEAWKLGKIDWIKQTIKRFRRIYYVFLLGSLVVVTISPLIFRIWIGEKANVPITMALAVAVMVLLDMWTRIYDFFINGVGKIKLQMIVTVCMAFVNIGLAYLFAVVLDLGAIGVVLATIVAYSVPAIVSPIQAMAIINGKAKGVWNE